MKAPILATALLMSTLVAGAAHASAASGPTLYWYASPPYFCPVRYTTYGQIIRCTQGIWRVRKGSDAELFFPNILAIDSAGSVYYTRTIKAYKVVGKGRRSHIVEIGEQRGLGALAVPGVAYDSGDRHYVHESLSQLMDPTFGVRRTNDDKPITWSCNTGYLFYVATARGEVDGFAQMYVSC